MNWSDRLDFYKILEKKGNLKEEDIRPEISDGESLLLGVFNELSPARPVGMSLGAIPPQVYWEAQKRYGLTDVAVEILRWVDMEFLRKQNES